MKFQYLGTAAAEGIPALFCSCDVCVASRKAGGRALRTRSQAIIDGTLLIDFPADTYAHILNNSISMEDVHYCIITHTHEDHLYPNDLLNLRPGMSHMKDGYHLSIFGSKKVGEELKPFLDNGLIKYGLADFTEVSEYVPFAVGKYTVTPLTAIHAPDSNPVIYQITDGEKTVLYAHDTHFLHDNVWEYWAKTKPRFDLVSLDCTNACRPMDYVGHMGLAENIKVKDKMIQLGYADENTVFVCNHFAHNGADVYYHDFVPIAEKAGFKVSYDSMVCEI